MNLSKGKSAQQMAELELKELKNGRVAMIAIMGAYAHTALSHSDGPVDRSGDVRDNPSSFFPVSFDVD